MVDISLEGIVGLILGILIPALFWAWRMMAAQKKTHSCIEDLIEMHLDPESVFATKKTNELLEEYMRQGEGMHRDTVDVLKALNRTIGELTHYIRWLTSQQLGKDAPPYVGTHSTSE